MVPNVFRFRNGANFVYFTCVFDNASAIIFTYFILEEKYDTPVS